MHLGIQELAKPFCCGSRAFDFAFPQGKHLPSERSEDLFILLVTVQVASKFGSPIFCPRFWNVGINAPSMLVPKTTAHIDNLPQS